MNPKHTAILFFSRDAFAESIHKPLLGIGEKQKNVELAQLMISQTKVALESSGLDIVHFTQHNQCGKTFGEKLANAFQDVFNMGYQSVIAIGNDTPEIAHLDWTQLKQDIRNNKAIVGPTQRGGAYLIGFSRHQFNKPAFESLTWQGKNLYTDLISHFNKEGTNILELNPFHELNLQHDIEWFVNGSDKKWQFLRLLMQLLKSKKLSALPIVFLMVNEHKWFIKDFTGPPDAVTLDRLQQFIKTLSDILCKRISYMLCQDECLNTFALKQSLHFRGPPVIG